MQKYEKNTHGLFEIVIYKGNICTLCTLDIAIPNSSPPHPNLRSLWYQNNAGPEKVYSLLQSNNVCRSLQSLGFLPNRRHYSKKIMIAAKKNVNGIG